MKILFSVCLLIGLGVTGAWAKRIPPPKVEPVVSDGIRYTAPNTDGRQAVVEAWDVKSGRKLWSQEIYRAHINPLLEEDVQWVFIKTMEIKDGKLLVTSERKDQYALDLKTRKVEKLHPSKKPSDAGQ